MQARGFKMARKTWKARVTGLVSRLRDDGARVAVPQGEYMMTDTDSDRYELRSSSGLLFKLSLLEVSTYVNEHHLMIEGRWP